MWKLLKILCLVGMKISVLGGTAPISGFAGVPASNAAAATIQASSSAANPAIDTTVWYALCTDISVLNGTYTATVTYTATTN